MSGVALSLRGLTLSDASGARLLESVDLDVRAGRALCVVGETGSGKSLLALAVMGLLPTGIAAQGEVSIMGSAPVPAHDRAKLRALWHQATCLLPQEPAAALDPLARVGRQLAAVDTDAALETVGLSACLARAYPFELSGGMAQRVLLANAAASTARIVLADEPTKGLDPLNAAAAVALLGGLLRRGKALVVVTHDPYVVRALGGDVAVMKDGAVVESGPTEIVFARPAHLYTREWLAADPRNWPPCTTCLVEEDVVLAGHGLAFGYGNGHALFDGLDLHVRRGEVLALTGPSGCGKTTLGSVLLGLQAPRAGEVSWRGCDPYMDQVGAKRLRRRYQKLHQDPAGPFEPYRSIGAQLEEVQRLGKSDKAALDPILDRLRLRRSILERRIGEVSGGEAQRAALARLLLLDPWMIFADEPTSRLDPIVQRETLGLLREIVADTGLAVVLVTHSPEIARAMADSTIELGTDQ
jgi:peptide/nickel transport system ATP-binding protein